jgi:23S rRNA pseudouridine955/2504/2580 synthase
MSKTKNYFQDIPIIFDHNDFIVINKPYGLASQGGTKVRISVDEIFTTHNGFSFDCKLVHRLDQHTSGALILAKYRNAATKLSKLFESRLVNKNYLALVRGQPRPASGSINYPLVKTSRLGKEMMCITHNKDDSFGDIKKAETLYEVIDHVHNHISLLNVIPITGRKHQIRVHLAAKDIPVIGDGKYGGKDAFIDDIPNQLHLHCHKLNFQFKGKEINIIADLPKTFKETLKSYSLHLK